MRSDRIFNSNKLLIINGKRGMLMPEDCIFCKIAAGEIPVKPIFQDEQLVAFSDINPVAPQHVLVIPRKHIDSLADAGAADKELLGHAMLMLPKIAEQMGLAADGFRVVLNTGKNGGQTVMHLHWHILGGRYMEWPPG